jgi:hypothetical protein
MRLDLRGRLVLTVPEAGRLLWGLGRDAAYDAAERGEIPALKVGRRLVVPTHAALSALGWSDDLIARALGIDPEHVEAAPSQDAATTTDSHDDLTATGAPDECASPPLPQSSNVRRLPGR